MNNKENVVRYNPSITYGLSSEQINNRYNNNLVNYDTNVRSKNIMQIIVSNIFTLFNFLNVGLALAIIWVESYKNLMFLGVVICNTIISIFQEIHSKIVVDKLSVIAETKVTAIRNGKKQFIKINDIVLDDILEYKIGNQIITDSKIVYGNCEVDESFITGESDPIYKGEGDLLKSGSFIISGSCIGKVEHVGIDNYTSQITKGAKVVKKINSELMTSLRKIIKFISFIIVPLGLLLFNQQLHLEGNSLEDAVINTVAALIGMIPEGLVLLTSTVLAVSVIRLAKYKVLVQRLHCIETLARVDTICFDKTGTLTNGNMILKETINMQGNNSEEVIKQVINAFSDTNPTIASIRDKYPFKTTWNIKKEIPFSSERKWSGIEFENKGSYIIGAPEKILKNISDEINDYSRSYRVLALAHSNYELNSDLPKNLTPLVLFLISDEIRKDAGETLNYFRSQDVNIKIISGDNVLTVSSIAKQLGFVNHENYIDISLLTNENEIKKAALSYDIFGRVTPIQKKIIIKSLKEKNYTVAMIGDGVNDVLALREADCSVAIASGSDATRNISEIVLLDSNFDAMPRVVKEGRRTINNITRSATLFLAKTSYATILALLFLFISMPYPFEPIQLTLTSVLTIGIPSFILAIEPNNEKIKGNFLTNVISRSLPTAFTIVINIIIIMILSSILNWTEDQASTMSVILTGYTGFLLLFKLSRPFNLTRKILFFVMTGSFILGIIGLKNLFSLTILNMTMLSTLIILMTLATLMFKLMTMIYYKIKVIYHKKRLNNKETIKVKKCK